MEASAGAAGLLGCWAAGLLGCLLLNCPAGSLLLNCPAGSLLLNCPAGSLIPAQSYGLPLELGRNIE
jgi:hypothetical protein